MKTCVILDSLNIIYRSFYGIKPMYTSEGMSTNALFGFCKTILKLIKHYNPDVFFAAWDSKINQRTTLYPDYKKNRQAMPEELVLQKEYIIEFLSSIGVPLVVKEGYEADDVIAKIASEAAGAGYNVFIVSSDKDLRYLLNDTIYLHDPAFHSVMAHSQLESMYGTYMNSEKLFLYYSLLGDASDNVPGVKGIGEKTAESIISRYASLDDLYARYHNDTELTPRIKKLLLEGQDSAYLSYSLICPLEISDENFVSFDQWNSKDKNESMYSFFKKFDFHSLIPKEFKLKEGTQEISDEKILPHSTECFTERCATDENTSEICELIRTAHEYAFDTETTGGDRRTTELLGFSLCFKSGESWYIPVKHNEETHLSTSNAYKILHALEKNTSACLVMHHALYDLHIMAGVGIHLINPLFDTMVAAHLLRSADERIGLKQLSKSVLGQRMDSFSEVVEYGKYKFFCDVPLARAALYASADAHQTYMLYKKFNELFDQYGMHHIFYDIEMPVLKVLFSMERRGIHVSGEKLTVQGKIIDRLLDEVKNDIERLALIKPGTINLQSNQQIGTLLFEGLGLPSSKKKKSGNYSTDHQALESLIDKHPVVEKIIYYRTLASIKSRCVENMQEHIRHDGRIYTSFNQTHVATGRLSTSDPNMQNVPLNPSDKSFSIRSAFIPEEHSAFIALDYSQIELRVLAHLSKDPFLMQSFKEGKDVHVETAIKIYKTERVSDEQRQLAKRINFGIMYGLTAFGLSQNLHISKAQAQMYLDEYKATYPRVFQWMEEIKSQAALDGYVTTLSGRRRYIRGISDRNFTIRSEAQRIAINTVVQGSAAELMKIGMIKIDQMLKKYDQAHLVLQIHDEILMEVSIENVDNIAREAKKILEKAVVWDVPLEVSMAKGYSWSDVS